MANYSKDYTKEIQKIINDTKLTEEQEIKLQECINKIPKYDKVKLRDVFEDMYKLYIADVSTGDIAEIYNRNIRTIQIVFKNLGLERDRFKAQSIAAKKRDYVKVRESNKRTMLNRKADNILYGSKIEQYVRTNISIELNSRIKELGGEAIIGVNTITPVGELDIPIIILMNDKFYKYGIEVDGKGFHSTKKGEWGNINDKEKEKQLTGLGYKILRLNTKAYITNDNTKIKYENELKERINNVIKEILEDFK